MTRDEIIKEYDVDNNGFIQNPGKFEMCPLYAVHFWDLVMSGCQDSTEYHNNDPIDIFNIMPEDTEAFPELGDTTRLEIWTDPSGFIHIGEYTI